MKLQKQPISKYTLPLAFAIPCVGMLIVMLISGYAPFGDAAILYSDNYHQYYPFFVAFREHLLSGDSLLYSWDVGLGMDYLGLISYYLASPLYLLSVLVPESLLLGFYSLLTPLRLGLAGLFFGIFLRKIFGREDLSVAVFSAFYALCAWALGYLWNVMWLDTFALLPLVVLGTVSVLRERKFILYTVTLFLSVYSNYYIGFFVCIFVLLIFICWEICRWQGFKRFAIDLGLMALFSALAIGMTAILELPALAALQNTQSSVNKFPTKFDINIGEDTFMGLLDAMRQVAGNMGGGLEPTFKEGLPNVYCGVGTLALAILYLMAKDVKLRDRICALVMLLFLMLSFIIRQLDYIWHGFHFTNMIPYRFSFLYSFVMLYMAYRAWTLRETFRVSQVFVAAVLAAALLCLSEDALEPVYLVYNFAMLLFFAGFMIYGLLEKRPAEDADEETLEEMHQELTLRRQAAAQYLVIILCAEIVLNLVNFGIRFPGTSVTHYPRGTTYAASMIAYMHEREDDTLFFRAETTHSQSLNDGALNGYNGVSTFTSSANVKVTEFMRVLGYGAKNTYNRYCYEEASPVSDLFLGLKYMIDRESRDRESSMFTAIHTYDSVTLLQNNTYLPLGFLADPELANLIFGEENDFRFQNDLFSAATALYEDVWRMQSADITAADVTLKDTYTSGYCSYADAIQNASITYTYTVGEPGFMCVQLNCPKRNDITILVNGQAVMTESLSLEQMLAVGDVVPGDIVEIRADCDDGESGNMTITAAVLDNDLFRRGYEILNASTLELTAFENTRVEGTIVCDRDGLLYTSIPQNGNWSVRVDGAPAEITLVGDVMIGVELTEGTHTVTCTYENAAFSLGWKISAVCVLLFMVMVYINHQIHIRKGKYQK
ncbi:MAG: YfhO family protein [Oscillospiraceae bacterium]|nr:YfhO family protein [Oscillospiraceae bacterium]